MISRQDTQPPTVPSWRAGPISAVKAGLCPKARATFSREATVGKFLVVAECLIEHEQWQARMIDIDGSLYSGSGAIVRQAFAYAALTG
jgi:hypothetical protein